MVIDGANLILVLSILPKAKMPNRLGYGAALLLP
jgi:hypothetical protein